MQAIGFSYRSNDPSQRLILDGLNFFVQPGYENHPMTMVTWFGAWGYCKYYDWRLAHRTGMGEIRSRHRHAPIPMG